MPPAARIVTGDCRAALPTLKAGSVEAVITDPVYPGIPREYGTWNEEEWFDLMNAVVPEVRRVLRPAGSAVFVLKPNSERAGRMRLWLWEFVATWGRKWGLVQDVCSWNYAQLPFGASTTCGLMRGSLSYCVWLGPADCYRDQDAVLWAESERSKHRKAIARAALAAGSGHKARYTSPSASRRPSPRLDMNRTYAAADRRGGVTPFNLIPGSQPAQRLGSCDNLIPATNTKNPPGEAGAGHPARTAPDVARFWVRYLTKPGDTVLDPFCGSGTIPAVAVEEGRRAVGVEIDPTYAAAARALAGGAAERKTG